MAAFDYWLIELLNSSGIDGEVFGEYISGTLRTMHTEGSSRGDIEEALTEILSGCVEEGISCLHLCEVITKRWREKEGSKGTDNLRETTTQSLSSLLHAPLPSDLVQTGTSVSRKASSGLSECAGLSSGEKERVLAQYGCESDEDGIDGLAGEPVDASVATKQGVDSGGLFENNNCFSLVEESKRLRDQHKATHELKVERDKQARQTQKQKVQERKEKEKKRTQKHERRV